MSLSDSYTAAQLKFYDHSLPLAFRRMSLCAPMEHAQHRLSYGQNGITRMGWPWQLPWAFMAIAAAHVCGGCARHPALPLHLCVARQLCSKTESPMYMQKAG